MVKKIIPLLLVLVLLSGCGEKEKQVYQTVFLDVFDTVTTLRGYEESEQAFQQRAEQVHQALQEYHKLFDIYNDYPGGLKQVNDNAGLSPVQVDRAVLDLLKDCRDYYELTQGRVNVAMGSVLYLWHEAREAGLNDPEHAALPEMEKLKEAAKHTSFDTVLLDEQAGTVFLSDPSQRLDVGAVAKGWTAQRVSQLLPEGYMLNVGGNVCTRGVKPGGGKWNIAVQSPNAGEDNLCVVSLAGQSLVTSGDYQRSYTVDGKRYHHIIDPDTLMPSEYWRSVSILCDDSGLADCLSTALFLLPLEEGKALAEQYNVEVMWVDADMNITQTPGFTAALRE
ncbi:MAG: FAD:protein FMN transferase [Firmicutes bacterium]|nr:FAD:protein FMN transferase [Bacillota bacterium]MDY6160152.1 FAD:protein FMN transferase [Candidatus Faecousia sp.]